MDCALIYTLKPSSLLLVEGMSLPDSAEHQPALAETQTRLEARLQSLGQPESEGKLLMEKIPEQELLNETLKEQADMGDPVPLWG